MIIFIHGSEPYLVRERLNQVITKAKAGGAELVELDGTAELGQVRQALAAGSLFGEGKRLVVVRGWLTAHQSAANEEFVSVLAATPKETVVAVAEYQAPDKRQAALKKLRRVADKEWVTEAMDPGAASRWLVSEATRRGTKLAPALARRLVEAVGPDLWALSSELDKLAAAAAGKPEITEAMLAHLVQAAEVGDVWRLVDALSQEDGGAAVRELRRLLEAGEPPLRIFGLIVRQYRILIGVHVLQDRPDAAIAKELGIHPYAATQARRFIDRYDLERLKRTFDELAELDFLIKTGRREPDAALEDFVTLRALVPG